MPSYDDEDKKRKTATATKAAGLLHGLQIPVNKGDLAKVEAGQSKESGLADKMRAAMSRVGKDTHTVHRADSTLNLPERGCLGMVIDATASRQHSWEAAKKIQRKLFARVSGNDRMLLRLVVMRGYRAEDHGWQSDSEALGRKIDRLSVEGGDTRIERSLRAFVRDPQGYKPAALILIGDCCEERTDDVLDAARDLARNGIRVYAFHENALGSGERRRNSEAAEGLFRKVAQITGGAFAKFGENMPLEDLCEAVAVYCAGGDQAIKALGHNGNRAARLLAAPRLSLPGPSNTN